MRRTTARTCALACVAVFALAGPAPADSVAEFYRGKTISLVMGTGPGGSFDLYGRTIGPHLSKHIPGNPTIIMEHMPGAGGVIAGNHIYSIAPQDGTKMLLSHAITLAEKLEPTGVRFETAEDAVARRLRRDHPDAGDVAHRAGAEHRGSQDQGRRGDRLVCPRAPDLPLGLAAEGCDRRQVQDHHRACAPATTTTSPWSAAKSTAGPPPGRT